MHLQVSFSFRISAELTSSLCCQNIVILWAWMNLIHFQNCSSLLDGEGSEPHWSKVLERDAASNTIPSLSCVNQDQTRGGLHKSQVWHKCYTAQVMLRTSIEHSPQETDSLLELRGDFLPNSECVEWFSVTGSFKKLISFTLPHCVHAHYQIPVPPVLGTGVKLWQVSQLSLWAAVPVPTSCEPPCICTTTPLAEAWRWVTPYPCSSLHPPQVKGWNKTPNPTLSLGSLHPSAVSCLGSHGVQHKVNVALTNYRSHWDDTLQKGHASWVWSSNLYLLC